MPDKEDIGAPVGKLVEGITALKERYDIGWSLSMADALAAVDAAEINEQFRDLAYLYMDVASNILWASEEEVPDKGAALIAAAQELAGLLEMTAANPEEGELMPNDTEQTVDEGQALAESEAPTEEIVEEPEVVTEDDATPKLTLLREQGESGQKLVETQGAMLEVANVAEGNRRGPLRIRTSLIMAGAGNKRDNHWYPQEVLEAAGERFLGAKMYMTEHVAEEKGVRTEAAFIESIEGYDPAHGLIGSVTAYHPEFCETVRNMRDLGVMNVLQCSISAAGTSVDGKVDGEDYSIVQSIDEVYSVDWVTKAGAGGHAVEANEIVEETVQESVTYDAALAQVLVQASALPEELQETLLLIEYATETQLTERIAALRESLGKLVQPVRDNGSDGAPEPKALTEAELDENILAANKKNGFGSNRH